MPAITKKESVTFEELFRKSYTYLNNNFHKFEERNKIQVAIAVCKMAVPQKLEHSGSLVVDMPVIKVGGNPLEFRIGDNVCAN